MLQTDSNQKKPQENRWPRTVKPILQMFAFVRQKENRLELCTPVRAAGLFQLRKVHVELSKT